MIEFTHKPDLLWLIIIGLLLTGFLFWSYRSNSRRLKPPASLGLTALRFSAAAIILVCLLDPQKVQEQRHYQPGRVAVLLDGSRSMTLEEQGRTRADHAQDWIQTRLEVPPAFEVEFFQFDQSVQRLPSLESFNPIGGRTAIGNALDHLWSAEFSQSLASVLLISDGRDNSDQSAEQIARQFGRKRIPIHVLPVGQTNEPPDIILEHVQVRRPSPRDTIARVSVQLRSPGFAGREVPLRIQQNGALVAEGRIRLTGGKQTAEIAFIPQTPGFHIFQALIPAQAGERTMENNSREFGFTVMDQVLRVLYMEGSGIQRGVFQPLYLKHALEETPGVQARTLYCDQYGSPPSLHTQVAAVDPRNGDRIYRVQHPTLGYPNSLEELLRYDVIISSDIPKEAFTPRQLEDTVRFVTEFGGGFVMIGGNTAFGSGGYNRTPIDRILPVETNLERDTTGVKFVPEVPALSGAWEHPLMQIGPSPEENRSIWTEKFPPLLGFNRVDRAKPGAIVLLQHPTIRTRYGPAIILAAQEIGAGRTMAFTSDTTFLWGQEFQTIWGERIDPNLPLSETNCDSRYYKQFWLNAIRWLAANKIQREKHLLQLELARSHSAPGSEVPFSLRYYNTAGESVTDAAITVSVLQEETRVKTLQPRYDDAAGIYRAAFTPPASGNYILRASVNATGEEGRAETQSLLVSEDKDLEMADVRADHAFLQNLAGWSGGQVLSLSRADSEVLAQTLAGHQPFQSTYKKTPLWDKPWWLVLVVGLLSLEWALRRRMGMA